MNVHETGRSGDPKPLTDPSEAPLALVQWRTEIINGILEDGLRPSSYLSSKGVRYLGCSQPERTSVSGWYINPASSGGLSHVIDSDDLEEVLYATGGFSIIPVLTERPYELPLEAYGQADDQIKRLYTKRVAASFLVVCQDPGIISKLDRNWALRTTEKNVSPHVFSHLIFPSDILEQYQKTNPAPMAIPIKTTGRKVVRHVDLWSLDFEAPDYENPLNDIVNEVKKPIWVHGVRLPTEEDLGKDFATPRLILPGEE